MGTKWTQFWRWKFQIKLLNPKTLFLYSNCIYIYCWWVNWELVNISCELMWWRIASDYSVHPLTLPWSHKGQCHGHDWATNIPFVPCQSALHSIGPPIPEISMTSYQVLQWLSEWFLLYHTDKPNSVNQCHSRDLGSRSGKGHPVHFHRPIFSLSQLYVRFSANGFDVKGKSRYGGGRGGGRGRRGGGGNELKTSSHLSLGDLIKHYLGQ